MEKILFSNSFNQTEYLRTLAKLGQNTFCLRVMNDVQLCSFILEHTDKMPDGTFISSKEEDYIYFHLGAGDYNDAKNLRSAIDSYRDCVDEDILVSLENNLSNDFLDKKNLIKDKYQQYQQYKKDNNLYDKNDLILFVLNSGIKLDMECSYYKEYGITQVFLKMLNSVFSSVKELSLKDTFVEKEKIIHFMKAYGKPCEADYVFSEIQKYPIDECQIVLTTSEDALEVVKTAQALNIPYTSHVGSPIIATNAGILLSYLFKLEDMLYGVDGYRYLFNAKVFNSQVFKDMIPQTEHSIERAFNKFIKYAGWLRLSFDNKETIYDQLYEKPFYPLMLIKLQESLAKGRAAFIKEYLANPTPLDEVVISNIETIEKASAQYGFELDEVLRDLIQRTTDRKVAKSGHLYITDVNSAISSLRKHVFIIGLDSNFPGGPKENYLIYDEEYAKTNSDYYNSKEIVRRKETILRALIDASEDLYLTYPYFELAALEDNNPSSVFFDLFPGDVSKCPSFDFEDLSLPINKDVYKAHLQNKYVLISDPSIDIDLDPSVLLNKTYSPSLFHAFFEDENRASFLLSEILDINVQEEDDPYLVISSSDRGTLIHDLMRNFQKDKVPLKDFRDKAQKAFDNFILTKPPVIPSSLMRAKEEFLRIVDNLYKDDPGNDYVDSEKYVNGVISDILFGGLFDRLEKDGFGKYILVDYKTGRSVYHKNDDVVSCIQGLIYGYLINHNQEYQNKGIVVDRIEFRYPDARATIHINYTQENEDALISKVSEFKTAIDDNTLFGTSGEQKFIDKYSYLLSLIRRVK